jgi:hypothetical protein
VVSDRGYGDCFGSPATERRCGDLIGWIGMVRLTGSDSGDS